MSDWKTVQLLQYSWRIVREDKVFLLFPVVSALSMLLFFGLTMGGLYALGFWDRFGDEFDGIAISKLISASVAAGRITDLVLIVGGYVLSAFAGIYCNAAMFVAATQRLNGERPSLRYAVRRVNSRLPGAFGWSCFASTVGIVINYLISSGDLYTKIPGFLLGLVWTFATFFVVPVLVLEGVSPAGAVKRSTFLFRQTWGKQVKSRVGLGLAYMTLFLPLIVVCSAGAMHPIAGAGVALLYLPVLLAGLTILLAMEGVFQAALFRYATTGRVSADYPVEFVRNAYEGVQPLPRLPERPGGVSLADRATWPLNALEGPDWVERPHLRRW